MPKQNSKTNIVSILNITMRLFVVCTIIAAVVAGVYILTKDKIAENTENTTIESIRSVFEEGKIESINDLNFENTSVSEVRKVLNEETGNPEGYCVICGPKGFGGEVKMLVAFNADKAITAVKVMSHSETPGIGDKINKQEYDYFRDQFVGISAKVSFEKGKIDKISGSSLSSNAVLSGINDAILVVSGIN